MDKTKIYDQRNWYSKKARINKKCNDYIQCFIFISTACTSIFSTFCPIVATVLSIVTAICIFLKSHFHFQDNWQMYRLSSEALKHEIRLYEAKAEKYKGLDENDAYILFVEYSELIIQNTNTQWSDIMKSNDKEDNK